MDMAKLHHNRGGVEQLGRRVYATFNWTLTGMIKSQGLSSLLLFTDSTITVQAPVYFVPSGCSGTLSCLTPLGYSVPAQVTLANQSMTVNAPLIHAVPEPSSLLLLSTGLIGLIGMSFRKGSLRAFVC